jgi:hypothetical protein
VLPTIQAPAWTAEVAPKTYRGPPARYLPGVPGGALVDSLAVYENVLRLGTPPVRVVAVSTGVIEAGHGRAAEARVEGINIATHRLARRAEAERRHRPRHRLAALLEVERPVVLFDGRRPRWTRSEDNFLRLLRLRGVAAVVFVSHQAARDPPDHRSSAVFRMVNRSGIDRRKAPTRVNYTG